MKWSNFFHDVIDYPKPAIEPLVPGTLFCYVSNSFLNGWINYVGKIRSAKLITRYRTYEENKQSLKEWHTKPSFHTNFSSLNDDVHLIAKDAGNKWWYFHYDCDVSDCKIGILDTDLCTDEEVLAAFDKWMLDRAMSSLTELFNIDINTIRGWISG